MGLSSTEWHDPIKLQENLASVRAFMDGASTILVAYTNEHENLPHVLDFCRYGELL